MQPILEEGAAIRAEVVYSVRNEMACTIEDVLARRLGMQFYSWYDAIEAAPVVGSVMAQELRWDEPFARESITGVSKLLRDHHLADAVFVSDRPHMLRVLRMASDDGITAWGSPTTTSPIETDAMGRVDATLHELGALAQYFVLGRS